MKKNNTFEIGDNVEAIDDAISGQVTAVNGSKITIESNDGFPITYDSSELVLQWNRAFAKAEIIQKQEPLKKKKPTKRVKDRLAPPMIVDLHIHQLVKHYKHMSNHEMLILQSDTARHKIEFAIRNNIQRIVLIHGVGQGVLKSELDYVYGRYKGIEVSPADYKLYGAGATEIYITQKARLD